MSSLLELLSEHAGELGRGLWVTLRLVGASLAIALVVGTLVAALRFASSPWLRRLGGIYVEAFRNVPLLVLLAMSYAGLRRAGVPIGVWTAGIASLGLYTAAYVAEVLRSGVFAVSRVNLALSRLSRRLEIREQQRTGTRVEPVSGLEDQVVTLQPR
ncbi:MAG: ABC transporter permease subunit [Solirubrobacteraceae bacterium]